MFFLFNDTPTTEIYTLSLHDALPILQPAAGNAGTAVGAVLEAWHSIYGRQERVSLGNLCLGPSLDRKSTRLNSSHSQISYAVFCLKKKNTPQNKSHRSHHCALGEFYV